jgi:beta-glucosidase
VITIDIKKLVAELSLEEKAGLCSGADFWHTKAVERLGLPAIMVSDGPHGLRKQASTEDPMGVNDSIKAVCFPTGSALACSFDPEVFQTLGDALGEECQAEDTSTLLGPAVNMKRSPLCGRNFEYLSEDPYLAGELAAEYVNAIQRNNVGTSVKHYAANNQETRRMSISSEVDERTLREIYLTAFETVVKKAQPWTMMCSYNCINGVYSCENDWLLNKVLRKEWGFQGLVMTDWGAMNNRVNSLKAGLDLEMPSSGGITDNEIIDAVKNGSLSLEVLDLAVERVLTLVKKHYEGKVEGVTLDLDGHHELARRLASESAVLLKNDRILPLKEDSKVAFIGEFAATPRFQGGGSSHINCFKVTSALEASKDYSVHYAKGFDIRKDELEDTLLQEAITLAKSSEVAIIFAGLPDHYESEGYDRTHMNLPSCQNTLIDEIVKVQPNTVVILHNGSPVEMPWVNKVKGILEVYLGGQAVGGATVDLLYGKANPCGKLAETFPKRLQDNPSYLNFPGTNRTVEYKEGVFIGYRYYDAREMEVLFPFGYGLSYTSFEYSDLKLNVLGSEKVENIPGDRLHMIDTDQLQVSMKVKNTGNRFGKEIVQLYVMDKEASVNRPPKELKGFAKVALNPGEEKTVTFTLDKRAFAYYCTELGDWYAESGTFELLVGSSSRDILLSDAVELKSTVTVPILFDDRTTFADVISKMENPNEFFALLKGTMDDSSTDDEDNTGLDKMILEMMKNMPLHSARSFAAMGLPIDDINQLIEKLRNE